MLGLSNMINGMLGVFVDCVGSGSLREPEPFSFQYRTSVISRVSMGGQFGDSCYQQSLQKGSCRLFWLLG